MMCVCMYVYMYNIISLEYRYIGANVYSRVYLFKYSNIL